MRTCMFCQEQASSREDIWPQWLTKRFPLSDASCMEAERGGQKLGTWKNKTPKLLPARCVCGNCNSGWMSKLEVEMKPIVESILDKQLRVLDASSQAVISVWAVKTAMALEALYPESVQGGQIFNLDKSSTISPNLFFNDASFFIFNRNLFRA